MKASVSAVSCRPNESQLGLNSVQKSQPVLNSHHGQRLLKTRIYAEKASALGVLTAKVTD